MTLDRSRDDLRVVEPDIARATVGARAKSDRDRPVDLRAAGHPLLGDAVGLAPPRIDGDDSRAQHHDVSCAVGIPDLIGQEANVIATALCRAPEAVAAAG